MYLKLLPIIIYNDNFTLKELFSYKGQPIALSRLAVEYLSKFNPLK